MIKVIKWYDTVTTESAENGDYESCGNDERCYEYDNIDEAATHYVELLKDLGYYESLTLDVNANENYASDIVYACDAEVDLDDGSEYYHRVAVVFAESSLTSKIKVMFNARVAELLLD